MTCTIEIKNKIDSEPEAIGRALLKANQYVPTANLIRIHCALRVAADAPAYKHPGWLEYGIQIHFDNGSSLFVAMIQRTIDSEFEFHS